VGLYLVFKPTHLRIIHTLDYLLYTLEYFYSYLSCCTYKYVLARAVIEKGKRGSIQQVFKVNIEKDKTKSGELLLNARWGSGT